jgi:carbon storage regulator
LPIWHSDLEPRKEATILILTRSQNESIVIDDDIRITVLSNQHGQVKLGIEAPDDVEIWREEIYTKLDAHLEEVE